MAVMWRRNEARRGGGIAIVVHWPSAFRIELYLLVSSSSPMPLSSPLLVFIRLLWWFVVAVVIVVVVVGVAAARNIDMHH